MLRDRWERLVSLLEGNFTAATGCSGTDLCLGAIEDVFKLWFDTFGVACAVTHAYSCESVPLKQEFILEHWRPGALFPDLGKLSGLTAVDVEGRDRHIAPVFLD